MTEQPNWNETPVTLSLIDQILTEHPKYKKTEHTTTEGHRMVLLEFANGYGEFRDNTADEFVSWVGELDD